MKVYSNELITEANTQLQFIGLETEDNIKAAELSIKVLLSVVEKLKKFIQRYKFKNEVISANVQH